MRTESSTFSAAYTLSYMSAFWERLTAVQSATFIHEGKEDSMRVEASLASETTLDVISETKVTSSP